MFLTFTCPLLSTTGRSTSNVFVFFKKHGKIFCLLSDASLKSSVQTAGLFFRKGFEFFMIEWFYIYLVILYLMLNDSQVTNCFTVSLSFSALPCKVFISRPTFYFELHYSSVRCSPASLSEGVSWIISHCAIARRPARYSVVQLSC